LQASARKWPDLFGKPDVQAREAEIEHKMRTVRPVVETGCVFRSRRTLQELHKPSRDCASLSTQVRCMSLT